MNDLPTAPPAPPVRLDLELLETAKRRAARLRAEAIADAVAYSLVGPQALLRRLLALLRRTSPVQARASKEAAPCRS